MNSFSAIARQEMAKRSASPMREEIRKAAEAQDRGSLLKLVCPHVPLGTLRFADVSQVLSANTSECLSLIHI